MLTAANELVEGGVTLLQYRNKSGNAREMLADARELKRLVGGRVRLIMNDRVDLCLAAEFDGVHLGQDDLSVEAARRIIGGCPREDAASAAKAAVELERYGRPKGRPLQREAETSAAKASHQNVAPIAALKRCATQKLEQGVALDRSLLGYWLGISTHNSEQLAIADNTSADYLAIGPVFATSSKANPDPVVGIAGVRRARKLTRKPLVAIGGITRANAREVIEAGADSVAVISDLIREPRKSAEEFLRILG